MNELISIIIPVYNVQRYLNSCVESIICQTYRNWEAILIDDGSSDESGVICDEYARNDSRIRVCHKKNGGISSARNIGLKMMNGAYFTFIDSDDTIVDSYLDTMINHIGDADIVAVDAYHIDSNGTIISEESTPPFSLSGNENIKEAYLNNSIGNFHAPWAKLYKNKKGAVPFFDENLVVGEDRYFNLCYLMTTESIIRIPYVGYGYRNNPSSIAHRVEKNYTKIYEHDCKTYENAIYEAYKEWGIDEKKAYQRYASECPARFFREIQNLYSKGSPYDRKEIMQKIKLIFSDREFIDAVHSTKFKTLPTIGKLAKVCVKTRSPFVVFIVFQTMNKAQRLMSKLR